MFIDEETEAYIKKKNSSALVSSNRIGLWRIILVHNIPYTDARRNGKVNVLLYLLPLGLCLDVLNMSLGNTANTWDCT